MLTAIEKSVSISFRSSDPELLIAQDNLTDLKLDLLCLPQITSVSEFMVEYSTALSEAAIFIQQAYAAMKAITDPSILSSSAYKNMMSDFAKTSPNLEEAANDPKVLASVLLSLKGSGPLTLDGLDRDINIFCHLVA